MKVIFLCTANSCRSQMAESWARKLFPEGWQVASAGLMTYRITEDTRAAMADVGLDMAGQHSQSIDEYDLDDFDLVVTLSGQSTRFVPRLKHSERHLGRPISDPMSARGDAAEKRRAFAAGRDRVRGIVEDVIELLETR